jgi:Mg2+ and Co2+ transporter CorA
MARITAAAGQGDRAQPESDRAAAERLAGELRASSGQLKTWRKVTTLLDMFGYYNLTPEVRERIGQALADVGISVEPPMETVQRHETVRLLMPEELGSAGTDAGSGSLSARDYSVWEPVRAIRATQWSPGSPPEETLLFQADPERGVLWFEINVLHADAVSVFDALEPLCEGLTEELIEDLLEANVAVRAARKPDAGVVAAAIPGVSASESTTGGDEANRSKAGTLVFQPVGLIVGRGWVVSCWHRAKRYRGAKELEVGEPAGYEDVHEAVAGAWAQERLETSADIALAVMREVAGSYAIAERELEAWLESWELDFYRRLDETERDTLIELRGLVAEFRERLADVQEQRRARRAPWPAPLTSDVASDELDALLAVAIGSLRDLSDALRNSLDLMAANSAAQQLRLSREQARRTSNLEELVAVIASVLLVPTLIAEIYGGVTNLPGGGEWSGFGLILLLMAASGGAAYLVFRRVWRRARSEEDSDASGPG